MVVIGVAILLSMSKQLTYFYCYEFFVHSVKDRKFWIGGVQTYG